MNIDVTLSMDFVSDAHFQQPFHILSTDSLATIATHSTESLSGVVDFN
jgi:hypothetical protein